MLTVLSVGAVFSVLAVLFSIFSIGSVCSIINIVSTGTVISIFSRGGNISGSRVRGGNEGCRTMDDRGGEPRAGD